jgi:hypothetical protein
MTYLGLKTGFQLTIPFIHVIFHYTKQSLGWGHGSSSRVPAWQGQGPDFKPQYHKKKSHNHPLSVVGKIFVKYAKESSNVLVFSTFF